MDNSKIVPALLKTMATAIDMANNHTLKLAGTDLMIDTLHPTTDSEGDVLIIFLSNGQSLKIRATPFGRASE